MEESSFLNEEMSSLGEKGFLSRVLPDLYADENLLGGFGHDAAVIELPNAPFNLIQKIDRASYPVSLRRGWSGYDAWGRMAVTANCSDILASGGEPVASMVAVMAPGHEKAANVRDIIVGASEECRTNGVIFSGGDTKEATEPQVVGSCVGLIAKDAFLPRNKVRAGDKIFCAGAVGGFAGAYFLMKYIHQDRQTPGTLGYTDYLARPVAQWQVAREINSRRVARCGMDASDGVLDVLQTFAAPGVRIELHLDKIPYHPFAIECASLTGIRRTQLIFGGGDWNIIYSIPAEAAERLTEEVGADLPLFCVGEATEGSGVWARDGDGRCVPISGVVNEHFVSRIEDAAGFMDHIAEGNFLGGTWSK